MAPPAWKISNPHLDATKQVRTISWHTIHTQRGQKTPTENLVTDVVLPDELSKQFLIGTCCIDNLVFESRIRAAVFPHIQLYFDVPQYPKTWNPAQSLSQEPVRPLHRKDLYPSWHLVPSHRTRERGPVCCQKGAIWPCWLTKIVCGKNEGSLPKTILAWNDCNLTTYACGVLCLVFEEARLIPHPEICLRFVPLIFVDRLGCGGLCWMISFKTPLRQLNGHHGPCLQ